MWFGLLREASGIIDDITFSDLTRHKTDIGYTNSFVKFSVNTKLFLKIYLYVTVLCQKWP